MLAVLTILFLGCAARNKLVLTPIANPVEGKDYYMDSQGSYCMSPVYLEGVLGVKIEKNEKRRR